MKRTAVLGAVALVSLACTGQSTADPYPPTSTVALAEDTIAPHGVDVSQGTSSPMEVFAPDEMGSYPVVVTVHGGGWVAGDPAQMAPLAAALADRGMVVFNVTYQTMNAGGRFPGMVQDVACDIVRARELAPDFTETPDRLIVVAHSAGAHLAALVAFAPDIFPCQNGEVAEVDGFVGLAGPYDVTRLAILNTLFGETIDEAPELWASGNPRTYVADVEIPILLIHGDADEVVPLSFSTDLASDLETADLRVQFITLPGATHSDVRDPSVVADLITTFVMAGDR